MGRVAGHLIGHLATGFRRQLPVGLGQGVQPDQHPLGLQHAVAAFGLIYESQKFGRRCREPVTGSVPAVNVTTMGRTSTEEKHDG